MSQGTPHRCGFTRHPYGLRNAITIQSVSEWYSGASYGRELRRVLERETRIELATNSLEGCDSTIELLPPGRYVFYYRSSAAMTPHQQQELDDLGYLSLPGFMSASLLEQLRSRVDELFVQEGEKAGSEFRQEPGSRRLANLVAKGDIFQQMVAMPEILEYIAAVLGPEFKLSSLNARSANPMSDSQQPLHVDMGAIADDRGYWVCNTVWMLDDFTPENGALRIVPGSHKWNRLPDPQHPDETLVTGQAGTVVVMNAHCWHGGTANRTHRERRALHGFYCRRDKPQQQYQRALIPETLQNTFSPQLRHVLALDDKENDRLSSAVDKPSGFLR